MSKSLPNEATTAFLTEREIESRESIQLFFDGLDSTQKNRFAELAHHFVYLGFIEGTKRQSPTELTEEQEQRILIAQAEFYSLGISDAITVLGLT